MVQAFKMAGFNVDELFRSTMNKKWGEVERIYKTYPEAHKAKLTKSEETALHIAVSSYHVDLDDDTIELSDWVRRLVETIRDDQADEILGMPNDKGNTPLHLAAALGSDDSCRRIASRSHKLLEKRNIKGETPFFLAAKYGRIRTFHCLHMVWEKGETVKPSESLLRRNVDHCNILHAAISGEYFELAYQIILKYQELVDRVNAEGLRPLHILATNPSVFQSSSNLRLCDHIIYHCLIVRKLKLKEFGTKRYKDNLACKSKESYPANYETCMNLVQKVWSAFKIIVASIRTQNSSRNDKQHLKDEESQASIRTQNSSRNDKQHLKDEESQEAEKEERYEGSFPPNYATCVDLFKFAMNVMLIILGIGFSRIKKIREKKIKHTLANQIMNKLMEHEKEHKYNGGLSPAENMERYADASIFRPPEVPFENEEQVRPSMEEDEKSEKNEEIDDKPVEEVTSVVVAAKKMKKESLTKEKLNSVLPDAIEELDPEKSFVLLRYQKKKTPNTMKETPILVAARMGITEMVDKFLETFPVAIQDVDERDKNALLLAVENRQTMVFDLLMKKNLPEFVLYQVDDEGNSALHLAAMFQERQPWRIPGTALQMQWEIKWYKHVKHTMPSQYLVHCKHNKKGETAKQIFTRTHETLVKDGSQWLIKTSESCSVVAALIATVAFATSTTLPGGVNDETGDPIHKGLPAFDVFSIASLIALCFSVTALVFFLAILTSRCQAKDFQRDLPSKLLLGLTSLFTSIATILVSFCAGHFFILKDELHNAAFFIYGLTCLPITFFAFAQLPLYFDLLWSIIRKVPLRSYEVSSK